MSRKLFGPVCILWFVAIGGARPVAYHRTSPRCCARFLPLYGVRLPRVSHGVTGLFVLGAVFLTVTGAEALTADMGHFGARADPARLVRRSSSRR